MKDEVLQLNRVTSAKHNIEWWGLREELSSVLLQLKSE
jgi:hypothetical protein